MFPVCYGWWAQIHNQHSIPKTHGLTENPVDTQISSFIGRFINMDATVSCVLQYFHVGRLKRHVVLDTDQCSATVAVKKEGTKQDTSGISLQFESLSSESGLILHLSDKNDLFPIYSYKWINPKIYIYIGVTIDTVNVDITVKTDRKYKNVFNTINKTNWLLLESI